MMRHWGAFLEGGRRRKMETLKGVRGRKDVKRVRNGGREDVEGEGEGRRNKKKNDMNSKVLNGIHSNY